MRVHIRLCFQIFRCLLVLAATYCTGAPSAYANCVPKSGNLPLNVALPSTSISVSPNMPLGATLGSVRVATPQDLPFTCSGMSNEREARFAMAEAPVADFAGVYATNIPGVGMRITVSGGSFAGIDDGPRLAPYKIGLPREASHLTGFALQIDFIKTGQAQNGTLAAGKLVTVLVGGAELIDVEIPTGAVVFVANQCDAVHVGGAVETGFGTGGAFTDESLAVGIGCNNGIGVMLQLDQGYVYGSGATLIRQEPNRKSAEAPESVFVNHAARIYRNPDSLKTTDSGAIFDPDTLNSSGYGTGAFGANASGDNAFGGSAFSTNTLGGSGRPADFRR